MKKNKAIKVGVCSLLVGLLALTACGKKINTTTGNKTTDGNKTTTKKTTTKQNTTKQNDTTKQQTKEVKDYNVYVDGVLCGNSGNVLTLEYSDNYNIYKHLKVEKVYVDDTKEDINKDEYEIETDLGHGSGAGDYDLTVNVGESKSVNIKVVVSPKVVNITNVKFEEKEFEYNTEEQEIKVEGLDELPSYIDYEITGNKATDAGVYSAKVEFESVSPNYVIGTVPEELADYKWTIKETQAKFTRIYNPSRTCNNGEIKILYETNVDAEVTIFYKAKGADDSEYSAENIPVKAGDYTALLVIFESDNYKGCKEEIDFSLYKASIYSPTMKNSSNTNYNGSSTYTGNEQSFYDQIFGYDSTIMELSNSSANANRTEVGEYEYEFVIKDEFKDSFEFVESKKLRWTITGELSDYLETITCDEEFISIDDFANSNSLKAQSVYNITPKDGYFVRINSSISNNSDWTANSLYKDITVEDNDYNILFRKRYFVPLYGVGYVEVDGKKYVARNYDHWSIDPIMFNRAKSDTLHISLHDLSEGVTRVRYQDGDNTIDLEDFTSELAIDMTTRDDFTLIYTYDDTDYSIIIKKTRLIEKVRAYLLELDTKEVTTEDFDYYSSSFSSYFEVKASNFFGRNHLILNIVPIFAEGVEGISYKYFDKYYNEDEEIDFTKWVDSTFTIKCYDKNGDVIAKYDVVPRMDCPDFEDLNYGLITTDTGVVTLPTFHDLDIYVDGVKSNGTITYTKQGMYYPVVEYRLEYDGVIYTYKDELEIIYSNNIYDYAESAGYHYYINTSGEGSAYVEDDGNYIYDSVYIVDIIALKNDYLFATPKEGYTFNKDKSTFGFINLKDPEPKFYINYVFEKDGVEYNALVWVYYFGEYSENTNIVNNKIYVKDEHDSISVYNIVNDEVTITIPDDEVKVSFTIEDEDAYCYLYQDGNEIDDIYWDWETDERYFYAEAGDYEVIVKPNGYAERKVTIHVIQTKDFISVTRTEDEEEFALYIDMDYNGNLKPKHSMTEMELYGYFGDSSEFIKNDKIDLTITSPYLSTIYKDFDLQINAKASDTFDVYYDGNMPYAVLYVKNPGGNQVIKVTLYLDAKSFNSAKLTIGSEEFIIIADGSDDYGDLIKEEMRGFAIDNTECPSTMTLTTTKVYSDYSYAILMEIDEDMYDCDTFEELENGGYLFRVTDSSTLSVTIPITSTYFYIVPEGATTFNLDILLEVQFLATKVFSFENENGDNFYYNYKIDYDNFQIIEYTNAIDNHKESGALLSDSLYFKLDESELAKMAGGTYKVKFDLGEDIRVYSMDDVELTPDSDGYIALPVSNTTVGITSFVLTYNFWGRDMDVIIVLGVPTPVSGEITGPVTIDSIG